MPSRQWLHAWSAIRLSDDEGMKALKELVKIQEYDADGQGEMVVGKMTGDGDTTLMHQASFYGRQKCVEFMLDNGSRSNLRDRSSTGLVAADYAKYNECDVYDPKYPTHLPTRPHNKVYHRLRVEMGEYVEKDLAPDTPGISSWTFERKWPYRVPKEWIPDRPYHVVRDAKRNRKLESRFK